MLTHKFNDMLTPILKKISPENKEGYVMGDFGINLVNYGTDNRTYLFLDNVCSISFHILISLHIIHRGLKLL